VPLSRTGCAVCTAGAPADSGRRGGKEKKDGRDQGRTTPSFAVASGPQASLQDPTEEGCAATSDRGGRQWERCTFQSWEQNWMADLCQHKTRPTVDPGVGIACEPSSMIPPGRASFSVTALSASNGGERRRGAKPGLPRQRIPDGLRSPSRVVASWSQQGGSRAPTPGACEIALAGLRGRPGSLRCSLAQDPHSDRRAASPSTGTSVPRCAFRLWSSSSCFARSLARVSRLGSPRKGDGARQFSPCRSLSSGFATAAGGAP
jgi:hypothetical protein